MCTSINYQSQQMSASYLKNNTTNQQTSNLQGDNTISIQPTLKQDEVNFKGNQKTQLEASSAKKWGVGFLSFCSPGVGQIANGQWGKGIAFIVGSALAIVAGGGLAGISASNLLFNPTKIQKASSVVGGLAALALMVVPRIWSCHDAVKNATNGVNITNK